MIDTNNCSGDEEHPQGVKDSGKALQTGEDGFRWIGQDWDGFRLNEYLEIRYTNSFSRPLLIANRKNSKRLPGTCPSSETIQRRILMSDEHFKSVFAQVFFAQVFFAFVNSKAMCEII